MAFADPRDVLGATTRNGTSLKRVRRGVRLLALGVFAGLLAHVAPSALGVEFADPMARVLFERLRFVSERCPSGEISWTVRSTRYGNPAVIEDNVRIVVEKFVTQARKPLSSFEIEAFRKRTRAQLQAECLTPAICTCRGTARLVDGHYLEEVEYTSGPLRGVRNRALWHNDRGILLQRSPGDETANPPTAETFVGTITQYAPSLITTSNPFRWLRMAFPPSGGSRASASGVADGSARIIFTDIATNKKVGAVSFSVPNSLPIRLTRYYSNGQAQIDAVAQWQMVRRSWIPKKVVVTLWAEEGVFLTEDVIETLKFTSREIAEEEFAIVFPPGTFVEDYTVSPAFQYRVEDRFPTVKGGGKVWNVLKRGATPAATARASERRIASVETPTSTPGNDRTGPAPETRAQGPATARWWWALTAALAVAGLAAILRVRARRR